MDAFNEMRPSVSRYSLENHRSALIDTGACANALPSVLFEEIKSNHPELILNETRTLRLFAWLRDNFILYWNSFNYRLFSCFTKIE